MKVYKNISLKSFNTFAINSIAKKLIVVENINELFKIAKEHADFIILGGGSNVLFVKDIINIPIIKLSLQKIYEDKKDNLVFAQAGVNWNEFVKWTIKNGYYGLENLAGIPGSVGGAVVQNIGAYGVEVLQFIDFVKVFDKKDNSIRIFDNKQCKYSYRSSIFKRNNRFVVIEASFRLNKFNLKNYNPNDSHKQVKNFVKDMKNKKQKITPQTVYNFIVELRKQKLPDFNVEHNAGSFFKNPVIDIEHFERLKLKYQDIPGFAVDTSINNGRDNGKKMTGKRRAKIKIPAGWLIEKAEFKGYRLKGTDAGVSNKHALVLVNYGNATGKDILKLAHIIEQAVYKKFRIMLEKEVVVV